MQFYGNAVPANSSGNSDSKSGGGSSSSQEDSLPADNGIENIGLAVFKGDKLIGKLTKTETLSNLVITNKLKSCRLSIPDPEDQSKAIDSYLTLDTKPDNYIEPDWDNLKAKGFTIIRFNETSDNRIIKDKKYYCSDNYHPNGNVWNLFKQQIMNALVLDEK